MEYTGPQVRQALLENRVLKRLLVKHHIPWEAAVAAEQHRQRMAYLDVLTQSDIVHLLIGCCGMRGPIELTCRAVCNAVADKAPVCERVVAFFPAGTAIWNPVEGAWSVPSGQLVPRSLRYYSAFALCDGKLYGVCGDFAGYLDLSAMDRWVNIEFPNVLRDGNPRMLAYHGRLMLIGGEDDCEVPQTAVECYDPKLGRWRSCAPLSRERKDLGAVSAEGHVYAIGGSSTHSWNESSCEKYSALTDQWTKVSDMQIGRSHCGVSYYDGHIYVSGGMKTRETSTRLRIIPCHAFERYSIRDDCWESLPPLPWPRTWCVSAALKGKIYVFGFDDDSVGDYYDTAECAWHPIKDPSTTHCLDVGEGPLAVFIVKRRWENGMVVCWGRPVAECAKKKPWEKRSV
eukprot:TRINITY_DN32586_c0_g1_i5.p1 TRINITY_DN32586_c0_g1~~TRINITY_DN32586_c0_g1_i5.p1  ORF type:complete len:400 (+),score=13.95 TRINITY_DN32586_c0_g1_i5:209-1408(+)